MSLEIKSLDIPDVKLITPKRFTDARGFFVESWNRETFAKLGLTFDFCQDNQSLSLKTGTVRGLHFQRPPHAQAKLVGVVRGRIFDVAVDLRRGSSTFGRHVSAELDADHGTMILVPRGFAHGFCTLEPDTQVLYKVDGYYAPQSDAGLFWADEALGIKWPVAPDAAHLSPKDLALPHLKELDNPF